MTAPAAERPAPERPLPALDEPDTAPFWIATRSRKLTYQVCAECCAVVFYPRAHCTRCLSGSLEWRESAGLGTVYTFTVIRQHGHPYFRSRLPYLVGWIDLAEGFRMLAEIAAAPGEVAIGQQVLLDWEDHDEVSIPVFRPAG
jgi:uncharacterized OB-fold protein